MDQVRIETVKKLDLQPGDILHVKVGGLVAGDEWIPTPDDIAFTAQKWMDVLPKGTPMVISHHLVEPTILRHALRSTSWPPKVVIHD